MAGRSPTRAPPVTAGPPAAIPEQTVTTVAAALRTGEPAALFLGGEATREPALTASARIAAIGARLLCETFPARLERSASLPAVERLGYLAEGRWRNSTAYGTSCRQAPAPRCRSSPTQACPVC
ncbi:hypothetical protein ACFY3M_54435 [Streptomyces mirabilis]|uniref:hypothetical protein n=1 Tax=Streptomyces mirabilis TaxID=68239 RepID=UPI0036C03DBE